MSYLTYPTVPNEAQLQLPSEAVKAIINHDTGKCTGSVPLRICDYATTTNLSDLTAVSTTIDTSGTITEGMRILVKDQSTHSQNGVYVAGVVVAASCALTRALDFNQVDMIQSGCMVAVVGGTAGAGTLWTMSTAAWPGSKTLGTDTLDFSSWTSTTYSAATATASGTQSAAMYNQQVNSNVYQVRGVVDSNVSNLAAFTIIQDGITYAAGDIVLLCKQTTAAQNGPYLVGTVSTTAPLTRPNWWAAAKVIPEGTVFQAGYGGTLYGGSAWKSSAAKGAVVDTNDPVLYPQCVKGTATLVAGTVTLGATQGLWLKSTTKSSIQITRNTANTTTLTTGGYSAAVGDRTAGIIGTAAVIINACVAAGTINIADISTIDYLIQNW
jgi:hypothetical protein